MIYNIHGPRYLVAQGGQVYYTKASNNALATSLKAMAVEIYNIVDDKSPEYLSLFSKSSVPYSLRDNNKLIQQKMRTTTFGIKSFSYYGAHLWNSLPVDIKSVVTLTNFKALVKNWQGQGHVIAQYFSS